MNKKQTLLMLTIFASILISSCNPNSESKKSIATETEHENTLSKYNTEIPTEILTADKIDTRIGELNFYDGIPTQETLDKVYDNLDFIRGVDVFMNFIPATSVEGIRLGMKSLGVDDSNEVLVFDDLMDSNPLFLTGNTDTVYACAMLDLEKNGVTVVEIPPGAGPGTVNDAFFRFVVDMGAPGPDAKK